MVKKEESSDDDDSDIDDITVSNPDLETDDKMVAQYVRVNRTKQRYKWEFIDVILHIAGTDYIIKKMNAEITGSN